MSVDRLKNWLDERQKNKQYRPKRSISPKDESNDDSVSEEGAIRKAQIELEVDSVNVKNLYPVKTYET